MCNTKHIVKTAIVLLFALCQYSLLLYGQNKNNEAEMTSVEYSVAELTSSIDFAITLAAEMAMHNIPGIGLTIIEGNSVVSEKYYGTTVAGANNPVTSNTMFEAASVSEIVTAMIVLYLAHTGKIDLNMDCNKYLKSWKVPSNKYSPEDPVTVHQILLHCAGFNKPENGIGFIEGKSGTLADLLEGVSPATNQPLNFENRQGIWNYSHYGYLVLQLLIEEVTGKPFETIAEDIVFKPLGMTSSSFRFPLTERQLTVKAYSHSASGFSYPHGLRQVAVAQEGLVTTPADLSKLVIELMLSFNGKSDKILPMEYTRKMISGIIPLDPDILGGKDANLGYGLMVREKDNSLCFLMAGKNEPGATCFIIGFPESGQGAVVMTNCESGDQVQLDLIIAAGKEFNWPASKL
jgi:CubicO group peptidase (beta-lactamase class C family)